MKYKFYVQMDGEGYGPYSVQELMELGVMDDTLITEKSMNGCWLPANQFNFEEMLKIEQEMNQIPIDDTPSMFNDSQTCSSSIQPSVYNYSHSSNSPSIIGKWNWGAFILSWLWGLFNGVYWPLAFILLNFIPYIGWIAYLAGSVFLGLKGNELSWNRNKNWHSVEYFERKQQKWSKAGFIVLGVAVVLGLFIGIASAL